MTDHLTPAQISAFADGELAGEELREVRQHIETCLPCATSAIDDLQLKAAVAQAGRSGEPSAEFRERMAALIHNEADAAPAQNTAQASARNKHRWATVGGWAAAAVLLLAMGAWQLLEFGGRRTFDARETALAAEACDLHIAALAASGPPQIVSTDRHTVKPWFQGRLPFSFNLPDALPDGATLDGANLAYLGNRPVAQLLFSIGRHRVSVFLEQRSAEDKPGTWKSAREGFNVEGFATGGLEAIAVSDVDQAKLADLAASLQAAQAQR